MHARSTERTDRPDQPLRSPIPLGHPLPFYGAFESTYQPLHDVDVAETAGHDTTWREDLHSLLLTGVRRARYPLRWHRIEPEPGVYDWREADAVMEHMHHHGVQVIVDLVHHTSHPRWLDDGFRDRRFAGAFVRFAEQVALRYPWLDAYTIFNEPVATLMLSGHSALWPPYDSGIDGLARLSNSVLPAVVEASTLMREQIPDALHVWIDTAEHHEGTPGGPARYAAMANDRRHALLDLFLGHDLEDIDSRPFLRAFIAAGGGPLLDMPRGQVDVLGLDYYAHSEWFYGQVRGHAPSAHPLGFARIAQHLWRRYGLPMMVAETNIRGLPADRSSWLRFMLEQCDQAREAGVDLRGFCWFPYLDSCDWDSLLARATGRTDPVGVVSLAAGRDRARTSFTASWEAAAAGAHADDLPAFRFQEPCRTDVRGLLSLMAHWPWEDPPAGDVVPSRDVPGTSRSAAFPVNVPAPLAGDAPEEGPAMDVVPAPTTGGADLVVLSHLRWDSVWQRPHHLVSRFARQRRPLGGRTWFVEEPASADVPFPRLQVDEHDDVTTVRLLVPSHPDHGEFLGFDATGTGGYGPLLSGLLSRAGVSAPDVLLYTPMALDIALDLHPMRIAYDVMDDLASFRNAPTGMVMRQRRLLQLADVVFAGGRSLHEGVSAHRHHEVHLFPSGVETAHYASARSIRAQCDAGRVAGFVGVIDERMDLDLVAGLAQRLPEWTIRLVGPLAKITEADLPQAANIEYPGRACYEDLPSVMAGFDVALMPFALNEATRSISPTKTLEYLAAGLPVVSTRVPDVVADYSEIVHLADDADGFAYACRHVVTHDGQDRDALLVPIRDRQEWDHIATEMHGLMTADRVIDLRQASATHGALA